MDYTLVAVVTMARNAKESGAIDTKRVIRNAFLAFDFAGKRGNDSEGPKRKCN